MKYLFLFLFLSTQFAVQAKQLKTFAETPRKLDLKLFLQTNIAANNCLKNLKNMTSCIFVIEEMNYIVQGSYFALTAQENISTQKTELLFLAKESSQNHRDDFKITRVENARKILNNKKENIQIILSKIINNTLDSFFAKNQDERVYLYLANTYLNIAVNQHTFFYKTSKLADKINSQNFLKDKKFGINFIFKDNNFYIAEIVDGSSAIESGLMAGDMLLLVNQKEIKNKKDLDEAFDKSDSIELLIQRKEKKMSITISRKELVIPNVSLHIISDNNKKIGVLKIPSFMPNSLCAETQNIIANKKIDSLVIDLRENGGGLIFQARCVASIFLGNQPMYNHHVPSKEMVETIDTPQMYFGNLTVLLNANSASASELFAMAIADNERGIILGERSFGKASIIAGNKIDENYSLMSVYDSFTSPISNYNHQGMGVTPQIELKQNVMVSPKTIKREADLEYFPIEFPGQSSVPFDLFLDFKIKDCASKIKEIVNPVEALDDDYLRTHLYFDTQLAQSILIMSECYE